MANRSKVVTFDISCHLLLHICLAKCPFGPNLLSATCFPAHVTLDTFMAQRAVHGDKTESI